MTCCHLLNDRPEKTIFPLESALILSQEPVKIVKKHLVIEAFIVSPAYSDLNLA
jgi:hypothetical protein